MSMPHPNPDRIRLLLACVGIDPDSFASFLEWALTEYLVYILLQSVRNQPGFFAKPDALKAFRQQLTQRTSRTWNTMDLDALYQRVHREAETHYRQPVTYEDYLRLLWQVPNECAFCHRKPPDVTLHIDHIIPASRGGTSRRPNLQLLCAEHNLDKSNHLEVSGPWLSLQ